MVRISGLINTSLNCIRTKVALDSVVTDKRLRTQSMWNFLVIVVTERRKKGSHKYNSKVNSRGLKRNQMDYAFRTYGSKTSMTSEV